MKKYTRQQIDDDLYLLLRTIYHYEQLLENRSGLDYQKMYLLLHLDQKPPLRLTKIASELNIPMFSASRLVDALVEIKLIKKEQDPDDGRGIAVSLVPAGQAVIRDIEEQSYDRVVKNFAEDKEDELDAIMRGVEKLHQILDVSELVKKKAQP